MLLALTITLATLNAEITNETLLQNPDDHTSPLQSGLMPAPRYVSYQFLDPFDHVAHPVLLAETATPEGSPAKEEGKNQFVVFQSPATFEVVPNFPCGTRTTTDTAVIYEGMALRLEKDNNACQRNGKYTLRCVVEAPVTNVTIRLQLQVYEKSLVCLVPGSEPVEKVVPKGTITLPPIYLQGIATTAATEGQTRIWRVQQSGYSPLLAEHCDGTLCFARIGTAEFGSIPPR
ncbi:hypothetical protein GC163_01205 [bacterium]|nr:hypothetical protein [bacterium]